MRVRKQQRLFEHFEGVSTMKYASFAAVAALFVACGGETNNTATNTANEAKTTGAAMTAPAADSAKAATNAVSTVAASDIVDTAVAAGNFKTLAKALTEAGLIDTLKGAGPFTVFAPTDEAFAAVPAKDLDALLKDKAKLKAVLTYHVVSGKVMAADVSKMTSAKTVQGTDVAVKVSGTDVMINQAKVVKADIACKNGVIHVIDKVIMPK
jgi:uncharacterized surface protein with fasciclin (FAS1) repeats